MSKAVAFTDENGNYVWAAENSPAHKAFLKRQAEEPAAPAVPEKSEEPMEAGEDEVTPDDLPQSPAGAGEEAQPEPAPRNRRRNR